MAKHNQIEGREQAALIRWCEFAKGKYPDLYMLYAVPNGGSRNEIEAAHLKQQGVRAGVPDLCLASAHGGFFGLYIEMKIKPNKPTENQKSWLKNLYNQGYAIAVCYSWEEAKNTLQCYLSQEKTRVLEEVSPPVNYPNQSSEQCAYTPHNKELERFHSEYVAVGEALAKGIQEGSENPKEDLAAAASAFLQERLDTLDDLKFEFNFDSGKQV